MSDSYAALAAKEKAESEALGATAAEAGSHCISKTLATASAVAIKAVQRNGGRGAIGEPAADLRQIRADPSVIEAKEGDVARAQAAALRFILSAIENGYQYDAKERGAILESESTGLRITSTLTDDDRKQLKSFPIVGMTAGEWSARLGRSLADAIDETLAKPLTGSIDPAQIPAALGAVGDAHGARLGSIVTEAYHAGVSAASKALGMAMAMIESP